MALKPRRSTNLSVISSGRARRMKGLPCSLPGTVRRHRGKSPGLPGAFPPWIRATEPYPEQRQRGGEYGHHARQRRAWQGAGGCHQRSGKFVCYLFAFRVRRYVLRRTYVRRIQDGSNQRGSMGRFMAYELAWIESTERASAALRQ